MREDSSGPSGSDWVREKLAALRRALKTAQDSWPTSADRLQDDLAQFSEADITAEDNAMLSLVVDEALQGVDIVKTYPDFYQQLLANAELRQAFLNALEMLEGDQPGESETPPT